MFSEFLVYGEGRLLQGINDTAERHLREENCPTHGSQQRETETGKKERRKGGIEKGGSQR